MDDQFMEDRLREIESIDPYWQKFEWIKMREDEPELYEKIIEFKKLRGDLDVQFWRNCGINISFLYMVICRRSVGLG